MFLPAIILFSLASCKRDNINQEISGRWTMTEAFCGFCGTSELNPGDIVWEFNPNKNLVKITNNSGQRHTSFNSGSYFFNLNTQASVITVDEIKFDYRFQSAELILSDKPEADGPVLRFTRFRK